MRFSAKLLCDAEFWSFLYLHENQIVKYLLLSKQSHPHILMRQHHHISSVGLLLKAFCMCLISLIRDLGLLRNRFTSQIYNGNKEINKSVVLQEKKCHKCGSFIREAADFDRNRIVCVIKKNLQL